MEPFTSQAFEQELRNILKYWEKYSPDVQRGGFYGRVTAENMPMTEAAKSVVLNARILWTFSLAHRLLKESKYLTLADRAFQQIIRYFYDQEHGGVYWSVNADNTPADTRKQIYGQAFAIYGLSEYYRITNYTPALEKAKEIFSLVEKHALDPVNGGYREAFNKDWSATDDYILSRKPWIKSMNTHLHLLEAYTNLYTVWPDALLGKQTAAMLEVIQDKIIDKNTSQMKLFFDENWKPKDNVISYGHDIEASWLFYETAEILKNPPLIDKTKRISLQMAQAATAGLAHDGALNYEFNPETGETNTERSWWVLAEQLVGFYNAYQLSGDTSYNERSKRSWEYIQNHFIDKEKGEWYGSVKADGIPVKGDKISFWKCPYHNARACAEMWRRLEMRRE